MLRFRNCALNSQIRMWGSGIDQLRCIWALLWLKDYLSTSLEVSRTLLNMSSGNEFGDRIEAGEGTM